MITELNETRRIEAALNRGLFRLCIFVTLVTMALIVIEFFSRGLFFPNHMNFFYIGILVIYAFHKELVRWLGHRKVERNGEYFVYGWVILTTILYIINFASEDYYTTMPQGGPSGVLRDTALLTLEVLGVFIFTRCLKIVRLVLKERT